MASVPLLKTQQQLCMFLLHDEYSNLQIDLSDILALQCMPRKEGK